MKRVAGQKERWRKMIKGRENERKERKETRMKFLGKGKRKWKKNSKRWRRGVGK